MEYTIKVVILILNTELKMLELKIWCDRKSNASKCFEKTYFKRLIEKYLYLKANLKCSVSEIVKTLSIGSGQGKCLKNFNFIINYK